MAACCIWQVPTSPVMRIVYCIFLNASRVPGRKWKPSGNVQLPDYRGCVKSINNILFVRGNIFFSHSHSLYCYTLFCFNLIEWKLNLLFTQLHFVLLKLEFIHSPLGGDSVHCPEIRREVRAAPRPLLDSIYLFWKGVVSLKNTYSTAADCNRLDDFAVNNIYIPCPCIRRSLEPLLAMHGTASIHNIWALPNMVLSTNHHEASDSIN